MTAAKITAGVLKGLEPLRALSASRLEELAQLVFIERISKSLDPFRIQDARGQSVYLLAGELALTLADGSSVVIVGGTDEARHPLGRKQPFVSAKAITDIDLIRVDNDLLDIMSTWDEIASGQPGGKGDEQKPTLANWSILTGMFGINSLKSGAFSQLPAAHIEELLRRFVRVPVKRGQMVVREGDPGDSYYVIESGKCEVTRTVGGAKMRLAQLKAGDAFGEEALVSGGKRNATVTMVSDGRLLRLAGKDFNELLKAPLLHGVTLQEAQAKIAAGAQWLDVRYPSEFQYDRLPGALNIPLSEIRDAAPILDRDREYVVYCQTGRKSSAAAFLLAQRGFRAYVLEGGLPTATPRRSGSTG